MTIGVRGTIVRVAVTDDGGTTVGVEDGSIVVTSKRTGQTLTVAGGERVTISAGGAFGSLQQGKVEGCD